MEEEDAVLQVLDPDDHQTPLASAAADHRSTVDTSRPFRSVKEAVAIFGERFLVGDVYNPKPFTFPKTETPFFAPSPKLTEPNWNFSSPSPRGTSSNYSQDTSLSDAVKKIEAELEDTRAELKLLKEKESDTEVALASLNAELHRNMAKLARAEAAVGGGGATALSEEEKKRDAYLMMESRSLAQILSIGENEGLLVGRKKEKKVTKKKPIIPLVGDLLSRKRASFTAMHN